MSEPCKVHVGNLSYDTEEDDLQNHFEKYGAIEQGKLNVKYYFCITKRSVAVVWTRNSVLLGP